MAVYFEPQRRGWMDYAAPVLAEIMGGVIKGNNDVKAKKLDYDLRQQEADAAQFRNWTDSDRSLKLLGQPTDEHGNVIPFGNVDFRNDPNGVFNKVATAKHLVSGLDTGPLLNNINPNFTFGEVNRGGIITTEARNPLTGAISSTDYDVTPEPTKVYEANKRFDETKLNADRSLEIEKLRQIYETKRAGMNINSRPAPSGHWVQDSTGQWVMLGRDGRPTPSGVVGLGQKKKGNYATVQTKDGIAVIDKDTGEVVETPFEAPPKANNYGVGVLQNTPPVATPPQAGPKRFTWPQQGNSAPPVAPAANVPDVPIVHPELYKQMKNEGYTDKQIAEHMRKKQSKQKS